jgi:hypothetical protein
MFVSVTLFIVLDFTGLKVHALFAFNQVFSCEHAVLELIHDFYVHVVS